MIEAIKNGETNRENGKRRIGKRVGPVVRDDPSFGGRTKLDELLK